VRPHVKCPTCKRDVLWASWRAHAAVCPPPLARSRGAQAAAAVQTVLDAIIGLNALLMVAGFVVAPVVLAVWWLLS
jgi:hypothetical protein